MHALSFQFKRAHLRAVAAGRIMVERVAGMTPARFDLLYYVRNGWMASGPLVRATSLPSIDQSAIGAHLGLSRQTISRMLFRLEQMGWIKREPDQHDARRRVVFLTRLGLRQLFRATRWVFRSRLLLHAYEIVVRQAFPSADGNALLQNMENFRQNIRQVACFFGDTSTLRYDFGYVE